MKSPRKLGLLQSRLAGDAGDMAARRGRRIAAIAVSALAHLGLLAVVALQAPTLFIPFEPGGPPEPVIPVLLTPRLPPSAAVPTGQRPGVIRLHRRELRAPPPELPVAPLPVPEMRPAPAPAPAAPAAAAAPRAAVLPEGPREELRAALRRSPIGCANPGAAGLSRVERAACEERLGADSPGAAFPGLGLDGAKQKALDRAGGRKEAERRSLEAPLAAGANDPTGSSGQPWQPRPMPP
jgi:hypothetical protein